MREPKPRAVALLALAYRELASEYNGGELSLGAKMVHDLLPLEEDALFEAFEDSELLAAVLPDLAEVAPVRAEAVLHAFPPGNPALVGEWARPFVVRWDEVEGEMTALVALGVARG